MSDPRILPANMTPRGLSARQAAEYCGVSKNHLLRHGPNPTRIGSRNVYDRKLLDLWLDRLAGIASTSDPQAAFARAIDVRKNALRNGS